MSNFNIALLQQSIAAVGATNIATNQIELSPYLQNRAVTDFARQQGIHTTSYMTLGYGKLLADPVLADIAAAHGATPAQVALAWAMAMGYAVIPRPPGAPTCRPTWTAASWCWAPKTCSASPRWSAATARSAQTGWLRPGIEPRS